MGTRNNQNEYNLQQTSNDKEYIYISNRTPNSKRGSASSSSLHSSYSSAQPLVFLLLLFSFVCPVSFVSSATADDERKKSSIRIYFLFFFFVIYSRRRCRHNRLFFILFAAGRPMLRV
jgi:hypothetical protein